MIERAGKNIRAQFARLRLQATARPVGLLPFSFFQFHWLSRRYLARLVNRAVTPKTKPNKACLAQRCHACNAVARQQTTESKAASRQLLPYDVRPKLPASQLSRGFHNVKDLLLHSAPPEASNIHRLRPSQPSGTCPSTITQSTSQAVVTGAVACSDPGLGTLENHYWRAFNMNTFTGGQAYDVTSVEFGIEQAESLFGTDQPLTVNLYANHGSPSRTAIGNRIWWPAQAKSAFPTRSSRYSMCL